GMINVKKPRDYVAKTIELAGGEYALKDLKGDDADSMSGMNMQMEDFYVAAKDADIFIYNSTIGGEIKNTDELIKKNALFKDFKAVKEKKVYCTGRNFFQESTHIAEFMTDLSEAFSGNDENLTYIKRLN
ncbi:MAG: ABC transporter substrate-binding protein, partial [Lachnospiraceae bacterium]|nr:ABC transporter substrate-binding protein [Lachnospiraceae bacterium]